MYCIHKWIEKRLENRIFFSPHQPCITEARCTYDIMCVGGYHISLPVTFAANAIQDI